MIPFQSQNTLWLTLAVLFLTAASCAPKKRAIPSTAYFGDTLPMRDVVQRVNDNNRAIPSLFARHSFEGNLYDPRTKKTRFLNASGDIFMLKPRDFLMRATKDPVGEIFRLGSDQERFWFIVSEGDEGMWWGHHRNAGKDCMRQMPIRPDLIGEVLGVNNIQTDLSQLPAPVLRFNNDHDAYMIVWNAKDPDRWYAEKEIWYDRKTFLPTLVILFDRNGRVLLRAKLSQHQPVEIEGLPQSAWPKVATSYGLFFPDTMSTMSFRLSDIAPRARRTGQPKPGMIRFPSMEEVDLPPNQVIQIDEDCE